MTSPTRVLIILYVEFLSINTSCNIIVQKYWTPYLWACNITPFTLMPIRRSVLNDFPRVQAWTYFPDIPVLLRILRASYNLIKHIILTSATTYAYLLPLMGINPFFWTFILVNIIVQNLRVSPRQS